MKLVTLTLLMLWSWWSFEGAVGDPQTLLLKQDCSGFTAPNLSNFNQNLNASLADLRAEVSNQRKHFATSQSTTGTSPVYAMIQCRNYLSNTDCAACLAAADAKIRNCSTGANGARVIYDGCFLRYESNDFFAQIMPRSSILCGSQSADESTAFSEAGQQVLTDLQIATPKITGYYAATKTQVAGGAIYAIAQCAETLTQDNCLECLSNEQTTVQGCLPNTNGRAFDAGCFMRYSETPFFSDNQTIDIAPFLNQGGRSTKKWFIIGGVVGGLVLVVILLLSFLIIIPGCRRSQIPKRVPRGNILEGTQLKGPTKFKYSDLKAATKNFSEKNKLGEGGFGAVYKGTMKNGKVVAVKKLISGNSSKIDDDFESEVMLISNVHHRNLVQLLGCCSKGQDRILVYEYMANNSLDKFLFGNRRCSLNWKQRYDIILGTARGLTYLHEEFHVSIIHRDIKSCNILLDEELQPKISDFGLVKLLPEDKSHLSTRFAGTVGYTAPEYALHGQLSKKADTYSYGIVVLEIISGQKSTDVRVDDDGEEESLLRQTHRKMVQLKVVALTLLVLWSWRNFEGAVGDPQLYLLTLECSGFMAPNLSNFYQNLNASLADLRAQVTSQSRHFATAQSTSRTDPVYAMFQCRNYLSITDCATCLAAAATEIRNCSVGTNGAHVVYDGCFLRYESTDSFNQISSSSHTLCGNQTADESTGYGAVGHQVLMDLQIATPKISGYFAATKTQVSGGAIYAVAQCAETFTQDNCLDCLSNEQSSMQGCLPNTNGRAFDPPGCFMRYSETPFFADNQTIDISPFFKQATDLNGPTKYRYSDLKAATKNFNEKNKLGEGGFGAVYKGTMKNGKVVAVKKLISGDFNKVDDEFESEVTLISNVHHRNLVRLLGCCSEGQERILVYQYMANTSLDKFLFGKRKGSLNWKQRYDIILGTARGLTYLHEEFHVSIIHRDIKSGNILLDEQLQPKISDFGLAKLLPEDQSHVRTRVAGTLGYTAPEYVLHGQLSEKADTYSYGIVALEIISGQKSTDVKVVDDDGDEEYLLRRAWKLYERGMLLELVDKSLDPNNYDAEEVKKVIAIALLCTQASAAMRPAMSEVVVLLNCNNLLEHMRPSMPIFIESNLRPQRDIFASTGSSTSNATTSNSI
ncbi:Cysteine-rich receptor-like protein kinase 2 [Glycine max]|nr:Cysteine-rich receptor-like protein kinase 2 [Glycine max]